MKGSTKFWIGMLISGIIYGIYLLISNWDTFTCDDKIRILLGITITILLWEVITGSARDIEETTYKPGEIHWHWYLISIIWWIYVLIKYYLNSFLDKILKD